MNVEEIKEIIKRAEYDDIWKSYLLSKLTVIDEPHKYFDIIKEHGYFNPQNNPKITVSKDGSYSISYWEILGYLENLANYNKDNYTEKFSNELLEIINSIMFYCDENKKRVDNYRTNYSMIKILFTLPLSFVSSSHIEFMRSSLSSEYGSKLMANELVNNIMPFLIKVKSKQLIFDLFNVILEYTIDEKSYFSKYVSLLGDYWFEDFLTKNKSHLFKLCGLDLYDITYNKIKYIIKSDDSSVFDFITTIEDSTQNISTNNYLMQLVFFVRDLLLSQDTTIIKDIVQDLLNEPYAIFQRLSLYIVNCNYDTLGNIFWNWDIKNPLENYLLKHELFSLIYEKSSLFNKNEVLKALSWIENEDLTMYADHFKNSDEKVKAIAYHKKEWLLSLLETNNDAVKELYEECNSIAPEKIDHPGYRVWFSGVVQVPEPEPFEDKVLVEPNSVIAESLKKGFIIRKGPFTREDKRVGRLRRSVKENPIKFTSDLDPFLTVPQVFQHALLSGLYDSWKDGTTFEWRELLDHIYKIVSSNSYWEVSDDPDNYTNWLTQKIADLIRIGTKDDSHAFGENLLPEAEKILLVLASRDKSAIQKKVDVINAVLNSSKGSIYASMIEHSLRCARLRKAPFWVESFRDFFDKQVNKINEPSIELYVTLGQFLPNINYLDPEWIVENINNIFPKDDEEYWEAAFSAYLFSSIRVYKGLYDLIKRHNHYQKAINTNFSEDSATRKLVQQIVIGFLNKFEVINEDNDLMSQIIHKKNPDQLSSLVNFVWRISDKLNDEQKELVYSLWNTLITELSSNEDDPEIQKIFSNMIFWIKLLDNLDDTAFSLLKYPVKYIEAGYNFNFLIEHIGKYVDTSPGLVGKLLYISGKKGSIVHYKEKEIQLLVTNIYEKGEKIIADKICEQYWNNKTFFLKDIYDRYN